MKIVCGRILKQLFWQQARGREIYMMICFNAALCQGNGTLQPAPLTTPPAGLVVGGTWYCKQYIFVQQNQTVFADYARAIEASVRMTITTKPCSIDATPCHASLWRKTPLE
jgi:hypothetical protein